METDTKPIEKPIYTIANGKRKKTLKKPEDNQRMMKYFVAKQSGMTKAQAEVSAGYPHPNHSSRIEKSITYQAIEKKYYRDVLLSKISMSGIADEQLKVILQDKDNGAKNKAIEMALNRIEPEVKITQEESILVVLK